MQISMGRYSYIRSFSRLVSYATETGGDVWVSIN